MPSTAALAISTLAQTAPAPQGATQARYLALVLGLVLVFLVALAVLTLFRMIRRRTLGRIDRIAKVRTPSNPPVSPWAAAGQRAAPVPARSDPDETEEDEDEDDDDDAEIEFEFEDDEEDGDGMSGGMMDPDADGGEDGGGDGGGDSGDWSPPPPPNRM